MKTKIINWITQKIKNAEQYLPSLSGMKNIKKFIPQMSGVIGYLMTYYIDVSLMIAFVFFLGLGAFLMDCYNAWPAHRTNMLLHSWNRIYLFLRCKMNSFM